MEDQKNSNKQTSKRPLYVRLTETERKAFDAYCDKFGVNFSVIIRAMIKDCLNRIEKGELNLDIVSGFSKIGRSASQS